MNVNIRLIIVGVVVVVMIGTGAFYYFTVQNKPTYSLSLQVTGSGSVSKSPDQSSYAQGTVVTMTSTPSVGYTFSGWSGDLSGSANPATITMDAAKNVKTTFTVIDNSTHSLILQVTGSGQIIINGAMSVHNATFSKVNYGGILQLAASPAEGWKFIEWAGDMSGSTNPINVVMTKDFKIIAVFTK